MFLSKLSLLNFENMTAPKRPTVFPLTVLTDESLKHNRNLCVCVLCRIQQLQTATISFFRKFLSRTLVNHSNVNSIVAVWLKLRDFRNSAETCKISEFLFTPCVTCVHCQSTLNNTSVPHRRCMKSRLLCAHPRHAIH